MKTKLKHILISIACLCFLGGMVACSDFLEEKPKSSQTTNQYFQTPEQAQALVNSLYRRGFLELYGAGSAYAGPSIMLGGYLSGFFDHDYPGQEQYVLLCQQLEVSGKQGSKIIDRLDGVWNQCYVAISRANTAIKYLPEIPGLSDTDRKNLLAQAKFFRALNYFHLVKFFGDVPLITEPYESLEDLYLPRTGSKEVYAQIEADLKEATEGLNDAAFTSNNFRVSKTTAETLLAAVYLQWSGYPLEENHYAQAAEMAKSVINSGKHQLLEHKDAGLNSAYNILRTTDVNEEIIYSYEFESSINSGGWWPSYALTDEAQDWKNGDDKLIKYGITKNVYRAIPAFLNMYDSVNDLRRHNQQFFYNSATIEGHTYNLQKTCNWFFFDKEALIESGRSSQDKPIFRYAEVLLIAAEATAQLGNVSEAAGYLAQVRARAYQTSTSEIESSLTGLSKEAFTQEVWKERLREFPLEFKIWDDIQRTRMYPQADNGAITFSDVIGAINPWGATFKKGHLLWPISEREMLRNPSLIQNEGY